MDIYNLDETVHGVIKIDAARLELAKSGAINLESTRRATVAEITAAALLDIASSLRLVAAEAGLAMAGSGMFSDPYADVEPEPVTDETRDFLVIGDLVHLRGQDRTGEVVKLGFSEDEVVADVVFVGDDGPSRLFARDLVRLRGDEATVEEAAKDEVESAVAEEDLVDDIDADFDGDTHEAAASALDLLKANEAARKAGKKKGKKS